MNNYKTIEKNTSIIPIWVPVVIGNLIPLYGALFLSWDIFSIFFLFWIENIIIGFYTVLRMVAIGGVIAISAPRAIKIAAVLGSSFFAGFFTIHYGMFCMGHFSFLVSMFYEGDYGRVGFDTGEVFLFIKYFATGGLFWGVLAIFIAEGVKAAIVFTTPNDIDKEISKGKSYLKQNNVKLPEKYKDFDPSIMGKAVRLPRLMMEPYGRIIVLHITIIFGGMLVQFLGDPIWGLALLIILKIAYDFGIIDPMKREKEKKLRKNRGMS